MALKGFYGCLKYLVIFFNLLFWLAGIGVLAISIWLFVESNEYLQGSPDSYKYFTAIYILMGAGGVMTVVGFLGCFGAMRESQCMLASFFIFLLVIFAAEVTGGVWAWLHKDQVNKALKDHIKDMVLNKYDRVEVVTKSVDAMQHDLQCCGIDEPSDWSKAYFNNKEMSQSRPLEIGVSGFNYNLPSTCCEEPDSGNCESARKIRTLGVILNGIHQKGCAQAFLDKLENHMALVIGVGIGLGIIQILGLIFSMVLCCAIRHGEGGGYKA